MALYQFRCHETGEEREVHAPMSNPPGLSFDEDGKHWVRVFDFRVTVGNDGAVKHRGQRLPISRGMSLDDREGKIVNRWGHQVREHSDGTHSTLDGQRIIDSKRSRERHKKHSGYFEEGESPK